VGVVVRVTGRWLGLLLALIKKILSIHYHGYFFWELCYCILLNSFILSLSVLKSSWTQTEKDVEITLSVGTRLKAEYMDIAFTDDDVQVKLVGKKR
jgi:hypothetical protein